MILLWRNSAKTHGVDYSCICNISPPCALHNLVAVNQIVDKNPLRIFIFVTVQQ